MDAPGADHEPKLGKRRAVYCALRVEQPAIVAETGVHNGLGSAVVLRALERNEAEGRPGKLLAFDIEPETGWLVDRDRHSERFHFYLGDTKSTLPAVLAEHGVDFFIHDSVHQYEFEVFEFETALQHSRASGWFSITTTRASRPPSARSAAETTGAPGRCRRSPATTTGGATSWVSASLSVARRAVIRRSSRWRAVLEAGWVVR